jgi:phage pi2 protein 07
MATITIPKKEYQELIEKKFRYEYLRQIIEEDIFSSPPTRSIKEVLKAFKGTKKYSQQFLKSLEKGLSRSSYFGA